jgi:uncharacterized membrane protein (UPF0127 family)
MGNPIVIPHIAYYFRTPRDIQNGLMGVRHLARDSVALFDMGKTDDYRFYMKNTVIPLDIIFIDDDGIVVGVLENMQPLDTTSKGVGRPSRYVIEAEAGYAIRNDVIPDVTMVKVF